MNKRISILLITLISLLSVSYTTIVTPKNLPLTNPPAGRADFNKANLFISSPYPFGIRTVVIDAGHGGKDPGCIGKKIYEKDAALGIALKLGKYIIEKTPDVKVVYTRKTDIFLDLDERAAIANNHKADLFICIHGNSACSVDKKTKKEHCNEETSGTETYVMGLHKSNANLNVAKRENASILLEKNYKKKYDGFDPNSETGYILLTMQQNAFLKQSLNFAAKIQRQMKEKAGRVDKGVQQAGFLVLWKTAMPSVLIETEFLSNPESEKLLGSEKGQDHIARAIFSAFRQYKDEVEGKFTRYTDDIETGKSFIPKKDTLIEKIHVKDSTFISKEPIIETDTAIKLVSQDTSIAKADTANNIPAKKDSSNYTPPPPLGEAGRGSDIIYKVQFLSSDKRIPLLSDTFKGLKEVGEYEDNGFYKYTAGEFKTLAEAMKYRTALQGKGHSGCFVVKFKNGKRMKNDKPQ